MSLADSIRDAVGVVHSYTADLQVEIQIEPWMGPPITFGGPDQFAGPIFPKGFVQEGEVHHKRANGQAITTRAKVAFLGPVPPNGAPGRQEPIDPRDRVTLPSGLSGHLVQLPDVMTNPQTGQPYVRVMWLA